ncbi:hypothetical protein A7K91_17610 [Paenibacillus oryzae]|uniref:Uncharacterized protein n=1 Tax=Paenibacillus oryzae TaxID=1844972 RepID=A0A1A5YJW0_9BACL|nr:hypothetical protein A7K91_17610 [Paenibacillus oryzae]
MGKKPGWRQIQKAYVIFKTLLKFRAINGGFQHNPQLHSCSQGSVIVIILCVLFIVIIREVLLYGGKKNAF